MPKIAMGFMFGNVHVARQTAVLGLVVIFLALIGTVASVHRMLLVASVIRASANDPFEPFFTQPSMLTIAHVAPGLLFMLLGPFQFVRRIRSRYVWWHRWSGRVFVFCSAIVAITALLMAFVSPISGRTEEFAALVFAPLFLFELAKAVVHVRRREIAKHRVWMIRSFALGLAISTMRPMIAAFIAFSNLAVPEFFGGVLWAGFTLHIAAAEAWIYWTSPRTRHRLSAETLMP